MNARRQLNSMYAYATIFAAAWIGACANSWWMFGAALAVLLGLSIHAGRIRLTPRPRY